MALRAISDGWVEAEMSSCRQTQLFRAAQKPAPDSTIRNLPDGHRPSELGMWSMFRGNRMPVRRRYRLVLFMSLSRTARL